MKINEVLKLCQRKDSRVQLLETAFRGYEVEFEFVIKDRDGTQARGVRRFPLHTEFEDFSDFMGELWFGELEELPPDQHASEASLWWAAGIALLSGLEAAILHHWIPSQFPSIVFILGVVMTAKLFGSRHALVAALMCPVLHNLLVMPPEWAFTPPTVGEYVLAALYVTLALAVPMLGQVRPRLKGLIMAIEEKIKEKKGFRVET